MELYQSYISTVAKASLSLYEQKILIKMVEYGQTRLQNLVLSAHRQVLEHHYNMVTVEIPIAYLLEPNNNHYEYVIKACQLLEQRKFSYKDAKGNITVCSWVMRATHIQNQGIISLIVDKTFFDALYNFTSGFVHYDLERSLSFKHASTIRLYTILNANRRPLEYSIEYLKEVFGVADKYSRNNDFIRKVIDVAYRELKEASDCNMFDYECIKTGNKITHIRFKTIVRVQSDTQRAAYSAARAWLPQEMQQLLIMHAGFTLRELSVHKAWIADFCKLPDAAGRLITIVQRARKGRKTKGYIINAIKGEVTNWKN